MLENNTYIITHTDGSGNVLKYEYKTLCYAINHLLVFIYKQPHGDYTITFTRKRGRKKNCN